MAEIFSSAARNIFDEAIGAMRLPIEGASPDVLNRKPGGADTNSITVLAVHSMHSTRSWISVAVGAPLPARNRDDEFIATMPNAAALLAFVDAMAADCVTLLEQAHVADWAAPAQTHARPQPYGEGKVPAAWALLHAFEHLGEHTGQMQLTRQLVDTGWTPPESQVAGRRSQVAGRRSLVAGRWSMVGPHGRQTPDSRLKLMGPPLDVVQTPKFKP